MMRVRDWLGLWLAMMILLPLWMLDALVLRWREERANTD